MSPVGAATTMSPVGAATRAGPAVEATTMSPTGTGPVAGPVAPGAPSEPACRAGQPYVAPTMAPVVDPFRPPATPYGPGNRGLEYGTAPGEEVRAIGDGIVSFAGSIAGEVFVTVLHGDGYRSTYAFLAEPLVTRGALVASGEPVGRTKGHFHLGVRCGVHYVDPTSLFSPLGRRRARLVANGRFPGG
jgi:murein DD-endopeptidase MepM/ murein hydrolase activator NlpD